MFILLFAKPILRLLDLQPTKALDNFFNCEQSFFWIAFTSFFISTGFSSVTTNFLGFFFLGFLILPIVFFLILLPVLVIPALRLLDLQATKALDNFFNPEQSFFQVHLMELLEMILLFLETLFFSYFFYFCFFNLLFFIVFWPFLNQN